MKQWISLMLVVALALAAVPAFAGEGAGDPTAGGAQFQALRTLPAGEQAKLTALDDAALATVVGGQAYTYPAADTVYGWQNPGYTYFGDDRAGRPRQGTPSRGRGAGGGQDSGSRMIYIF
jgi:hypothetical protein